MKVHELLSDPSKWLQDAHAHNEEGFYVPPESPTAVCWCLAGAILKCYGYIPDFLDKVKAHVGMGTASWNDHPERTYEEVLALVKELDL